MLLVNNCIYNYHFLPMDSRIMSSNLTICKDN